MGGEPATGASGSTLDLLYEETKDHLAAQREYVRALDKKAELILGSSSLIITIGAGLTALRSAPFAVGTAAPVEPGTTLLTYAGVLMFALAAAFYLIAMAFGYRAYMPRTIRRQVRPARLRANYLALDPVEARYRLLVNAAGAFDKNIAMIRTKKMRSLKLGFFFLVLETFCLSIALILSAL